MCTIHFHLPGPVSVVYGSAAESVLIRGPKFGKHKNLCNALYDNAFFLNYYRQHHAVIPINTTREFFDRRLYVERIFLKPFSKNRIRNCVDVVGKKNPKCLSTLEMPKKKPKNTREYTDCFNSSLYNNIVIYFFFLYIYISRKSV